MFHTLLQNTIMAATFPVKMTTANFWGDSPEHEYYQSQGVKNSKSYFQTPNGKIFTQSFLPITNNNTPIKGTVFMTHGYASDSGWMFQKICINYATWGYAVFAADLLGHGRSDGLHGYLGDINKVAASSLSFFTRVRNSEKYRDLPAFLFWESMGGMISMVMYFQSEAGMWTGLILSAPLIVIPQLMIPSKVTVPFLTCHGTSDGVTCPTGSEMLYEKASRVDKTLKLYEGMYTLIQGEPDENANLVLGDMRAWIDERVQRHGPKCDTQV